MRTICTNSNLLPIVNVDFYNGPFDGHDEVENEMESTDNAMFYTFEADMEEYEKNILESLNDFVFDFKKFGIVDFRFTGIYHPSSYNYTSDSVDIELDLSKDFETIYFKMLPELFEDKRVLKYIKDHFTSYDGFWSWMPKNMEDFKEMFESDPARSISAFLCLCIVHDGVDLENMAESTEYLVYEEADCPVEVKPIIDEDLIKLYDNDDKVNTLIMDVFNNVGWQWKHFNEINGYLDKKAHYNDRGGTDVKNDAIDFICWADSKGYTVADLEALAAA